MAWIVYKTKGNKKKSPKWYFMGGLTKWTREKIWAHRYFTVVPSGVKLEQV